MPENTPYVRGHKQRIHDAVFDMTIGTGEVPEVISSDALASLRERCVETFNALGEETFVAEVKRAWSQCMMAWSFP